MRKASYIFWAGVCGAGFGFGLGFSFVWVFGGLVPLSSRQVNSAALWAGIAVAVLGFISGALWTGEVI
jgi:hypothetical protein